MRILIINGPNLNMLGKREPAIYGTRSMEQVIVEMQRAHCEVYFEYRQSNHEGDLIDWIQQCAFLTPAMQTEPIDGVVLNAGGYTHTSIALRDAVACATVPVVEVHITDIFAREPFRRVSMLTDVCAHSIIGHSTDGYLQAAEWIINKIQTTQ